VAFNYSTPNARPSGHYLTLSWVSGKARSKERRVGRKWRGNREVAKGIQVAG
jgi:hypothetical protein